MMNDSTLYFQSFTLVLGVLHRGRLANIQPQIPVGAIKPALF